MGQLHGDVELESPGGADSWNVLRSTTSGSGYATMANLTTNGYVDAAVTNCTKYYYVLAASNSFGTGPNSAEVSVIPAVPLTNWIGIFHSVARHLQLA